MDVLRREAVEVEDEEELRGMPVVGFDHVEVGGLGVRDEPASEPWVLEIM